MQFVRLESGRIINTGYIIGIDPPPEDRDRQYIVVAMDCTHSEYRSLLVTKTDYDNIIKAIESSTGLL